MFSKVKGPQRWELVQASWYWEQLWELPRYWELPKYLEPPW
jgi:hypothetical protein